MTFGRRPEAVWHYTARLVNKDSGRQAAASSFGPAGRLASEQLGALRHQEGLIMATYIPPWLGQPPRHDPKRKGSHFAQILFIAAVVAVVGFLVALITAIVIAG